MSDEQELEYKRRIAELEQIIAETRHTDIMSFKLTREIFWYPVFVAAGLIGAVATATTVLIRVL